MRVLINLTDRLSDAAFRGLKWVLSGLSALAAAGFVVALEAA